MCKYADELQIFDYWQLASNAQRCDESWQIVIKVARAW